MLILDGIIRYFSYKLVAKKLIVYNDGVYMRMEKVIELYDKKLQQAYKRRNNGPERLDGTQKNDSG